MGREQAQPLALPPPACPKLSINHCGANCAHIIQRARTHTMPLTLAQAAAETGLHRSSILRAIKRGAVSGSRDVGGQWSIEPAELFRVFPPVVRTGDAADATRQDAQGTAALAEAQLRTAGMAVEIGMLREQLTDARCERDRWCAEASAWRDQAQAVTRQIADQRERRPWWRRLAG